jgi:signal transduction histidine kinase/tRNA A-37 threonylcarbamoyl transferase component Bud32
MGLIDQIIENRYRVIEKIGEGGMSEVFRAHDTQENKDIAIKFLRESAQQKRIDDIIRFRREETAIANIDHPGIVKVYGVRQEQRQLYILMEYLRGMTLSEWCKAGRRFSVAETVSVIRQIAEALSYVHDRRIIHRDMKSDNVMLLAENAQTKILDFGLAQLIEFTEIRNEEEVVGTFSYMSPEQSGIIRKPVDERSDLYSLGIIFYELLTGELPFKGKDVTSILYQQVARKPIPPKQINPAVPDIIEEMVLKLLNKEPEERYQTAKGFLADLLSYQAGKASFVIGKEDRLMRLSYRTRLIGREAELHTLYNLFYQASQGEGSLCLIAAEAGRGKNRLVDELRGYVYEHGGIMIGGKCLAQENKVPYQPFIEALNEFLGLLARQDPDVREKTISLLRDSLGQLGEILMRLNPAMKEILGEFPALISLDPERENKRFLMVLAKFFCSLGEKGRPCVLFLDDLHWADDGTLSLLLEAIQDIKGAPLLIVGTYRDNEVSASHGLSKIKEEAQNKNLRLFEIQLGLFNLAQLNKFVAELLLEEESGVLELSKFVMNKSQGNPFFSLEVIRQLVDEGALTYHEAQKHWQPDWEKVKSIAISPTIVDIVLRRVDALDHESLELLSYAAVMGREFEVSLLFAMSGLTQERIIAIIDDAIALQLLEKGVGKGKVLFAHGRIRDAFYQKIDAEKKKELHRLIARTLEELHKDDISPVLFLLAHHYIESGDEDKILQYALPAALKAQQDYANQEAVEYFTTIIDILKKRQQGESPLSLQAREGLIAVYNVIGKNLEAIEMAQQVLPLKKDRVEQARLFRLIGSAYFKLGDWTRSEDSMRQCLELLGEHIPRTSFGALLSLIKELIVHGVHRLFPALFVPRENVSVKQEFREMAFSYMSLAWLYVMTDVSKAKMVRAGLRFLNLSETKLASSKEATIGFAIYGGGCMTAALFSTALFYHEKAMALRIQLQDTWGIAEIWHLMGYMYQWWARYEDSLRSLREAHSAFQRLGDLWEEGMVVQSTGITYFDRGEYGPATEYFYRYLEISRKIKDDYGISSSHAWLTLVYAQKGELDKAEEMVQKSLALSKEKKIWFIHCFALINCGFLYLQKKDTAKAIAFLEEAMALNAKHVFLKEYTIHLYHHLAETYLAQATFAHEPRLSRKKCSQIRKILKVALRESKYWRTHYPAALRVNAQYYAYIKRRRQAEKYFLKSIEVAVQIGRKFELGRSFYEYGLWLQTQNRLHQAREDLKKSYDIFSEIGAQLYLRQAAQALGFEEALYTVSPDESESSQRRLRTEQELKGLIKASQYLSSLLHLEELLEKIMDTAIEVVGAERGFLLLYESVAQGRGLEKDKKENLVAVVAHNVDKESLAGEAFEGSRTVISRVEETRQPIVIVNAAEDADLKTHVSVIRHKLRSILCVPLITKNDEMLGIIYLDNRLISGLFSENDLNLLKTLAIQAAISIENAVLVNQEKEMVRKVYEAEARAQYADILRQKNEALAAEKSKMNAMVEKMSEGVIMFGEEDQLVILNAIARDLLGYQQEVERNSLFACFREISLLNSLDEIKQAYPAAWAKEVRVEKPYMRIIHAEGMHILDEAKKPLGTVIIMRDVTRERELDQLKNDFVSLVSHELRTPLGAIKAVNSTLLDGSIGGMNEKQKQFLLLAKRNMERLELLISDLLDVARIEAGKFELTTKPADIAQLIEEVVRMFEMVAKEHRILLHFSCAQGLPMVSVDSNRIIQVLSNLIGNAIKFTPEGGEIAISALCNDGIVQIEVNDNGSGIPQADLTKIFDKFYQVARPADKGETSSGSGLGLTICKAIVEKHKGRIWVESKLGKGSKFCFTLPVA